MGKVEFYRPDTFIKDIPGAEREKDEYIDALDKYFYEWVELHLPFYEEMSRVGAYEFRCANVLSYECNDICYEKDGHHYRLYQRRDGIKLLSLDANGHYEELNWRSLFWLKHPEFDGSRPENITQGNFLSWPMHRYYKKEPQYNIVLDRLAQYFKYLTNDPEAMFDAGWNSYIYRGPKRLIDDY